MFAGRRPSAAVCLLPELFDLGLKVIPICYSRRGGEKIFWDESLAISFEFFIDDWIRERFVPHLKFLLDICRKKGQPDLCLCVAFLTLHQVNPIVKNEPPVLRLYYPDRPVKRCGECMLTLRTVDDMLECLAH